MAKTTKPLCEQPGHAVTSNKVDNGKTLELHRRGEKQHLCSFIIVKQLSPSFQSDFIWPFELGSMTFWRNIMLINNFNKNDNYKTSGSYLPFFSFCFSRLILLYQLTVLQPDEIIIALKTKSYATPIASVVFLPKILRFMTVCLPLS